MDDKEMLKTAAQATNGAFKKAHGRYPQTPDEAWDTLEQIAGETPRGIVAHWHRQNAEKESAQKKFWKMVQDTQFRKTGLGSLLNP